MNFTTTSLATLRMASSVTGLTTGSTLTAAGIFASAMEHPKEQKKPLRREEGQFSDAGRGLPFVRKTDQALPKKTKKEFATRQKVGGGKRDRTADLLNAIQALSQLSYTPTPFSCGCNAVNASRLRHLITMPLKTMSSFFSSLHPAISLANSIWFC